MKQLLLWSLTLIAPLMWTPSALGQTEAELRAIEAKLPFKMGETIEYKINWGILNVGKTTATTEWIEWQGRKHIAIRVRNRTNKVLSKLYPVNDYLESIIDPETMAPVRFIKNLSQGRHKTQETTIFNREKLKATWGNKLKKRTKEYAIKKDSRDVLAFMYFIRSENFVVGKTNQYQVMSDEKLYDLNLHAQKSETIKLSDYGKVDCTKIKPTAAFNGLFISKGEMEVWVSNDDRRVATKIVADTPFANLVIRLEKITGPGDDFWVNKKKKPPKMATPSSRRRNR